MKNSQKVVYSFSLWFFLEVVYFIFIFLINIDLNTQTWEQTAKHQFYKGWNDTRGWSIERLLN